LTVLPPHSFYLGYSFLLSPGSKMRVATIFTVLTAIALFDVIFARRHTPAWKRANDHHHHRRHSYVLAFISCVHFEGVTFSLRPILVPMDTMVPHRVMVSIMVIPMIISRSYRMSTVANSKFREESKMEGFPFMKLVLGACGAVNSGNEFVS